MAESPVTNTQQIVELSFSATELCVMMLAIKQSLDDAITDLVGWLVQNLSDAFSAKET